VIGPLELFVTFVVLGLVLVAVEVIIPGGIVGAAGAIFLVAAVITAFFAFPPPGGMIAAFLLVIGGIAFMVLWLKYFPKTPFGKKLTLNRDGKLFKSSPDESPRFLGKDGVAQTALRPAGIAEIDGTRVDVVAESGFIDPGAPVRVVLVEGNRIVVRALPKT
jgi:membrane-bound serine protease (ClpP class)